LNSEQWEKVERLFAEASGLDPDARREALRECDPYVRAEVESLLEHTESGDLFDGGGAPVRTLLRLDEHEGDDGAEQLVGVELGGVTVNRLIARGGMSYVYEAEQSSPSRKVAVKVIKPGALSRNALRRFEQESEILARIPHPAISQVFNYGVVDLDGERLPYLIMEMVPGAEWITAYAERRGLSRERRLELFVRICEAIEFAHQNGVIHRDLKPSNILIDKHGHPKVIDFGVAHVDDRPDADMTVSGQLVGTLTYMSPEQVSGSADRVDTRADVYALGLVLYELILGNLPYHVEDKTIAAAAREICAVEPVFPRDRSRRLPRDTEAVIRRALAKDRDQRYQSVRELRQDIERILVGEPVEARAPTLWIRAARCIGRHPIATTATVCALIGLLTIASSLVIVYALNNQPHRVVFQPHGTGAKLLARSGYVLREWTPRNGDGILFAKLTPRSPEFGGGRVVVIISARGAHADPRADGEACLYAVDDLDEPIWSTADVQPPTAPNQAPRPAHRWHAIAGAVDDFLPGVPGEELFVIHRLGVFSPCWIRIFDISGQLRFQVAYDGAIRKMAWFEDDGVTLVTGFDSEALIRDRGIKTEKLP